MNAIAVLCHFCEQHGPSVIMCTQPYRQVQSRTGGPSTDHSLDTSSISRNASHIGLYGVGTNDLGAPLEATTSSLVFSQETATAPLNPKNSPSTSQQGSTVPNPTCRACSFLSRDEPGLMSHDQSAGMTFISTPWPKDQDLSTYVRAACQRSLSCEVFPEPEGAFYFGDEVNGHVVSYNFYVKDAQARGFQSRFSILVMSWDRMYLLTLYPFLIHNLSRMVTRIRSTAEYVYETEKANAGPSPSTSSVHRGGTTGAYGARCATPPPPSAGPIPLALASQAAAAAAAATGGGMPHSIRQRRAADADMRSLGDLTRDDQIFYRIHAWFTWLLRAGGRRWSVIPSLMTPVDEDTLVEQEERQATAATISELGSFGQLPVSSGTGPLMSILASGASLLSGPSTKLHSHVSSALSSLGSCFSLSDPSSAVEETAIALMVLTRMFHSLGQKAFGQLVQHVAVGNQTVVQPLCETALGPLVIDAIARLVPRGCRKQIVCSPEYLPAFHCNLLSLTAEAKPPEADWNPGEQVLFIAVVRAQHQASNPLVAPEQLDATSARYMPLVNSLHFKLDCMLPSVDPLFSAIRESPCGLDSVASFQSLCPSQPIETALSTYAQQVIKLVSLNPPLPPSTLDLALDTARQEWINAARLVHAFKRCQGPIMTGEETTRRWAGVLSAIGCASVENDNVARFWLGALSEQSRRNTCHTRRRVPNSATASRKSSRCSSTVDMAAALAATSLVD